MIDMRARIDTIRYRLALLRGWGATPVVEALVTRAEAKLGEPNRACRDAEQMFRDGRYGRELVDAEGGHAP